MAIQIFNDEPTGADDYLRCIVRNEPISDTLRVASVDAVKQIPARTGVGQWHIGWLTATGLDPALPGFVAGADIEWLSPTQVPDKPYKRIISAWPSWHANAWLARGKQVDRMIQWIGGMPMPCVAAANGQVFNPLHPETPWTTGGLWRTLVAGGFFPAPIITPSQTWFPADAVFLRFEARMYSGMDGANLGFAQINARTGNNLPDFQPTSADSYPPLTFFNQQKGTVRGEPPGDSSYGNMMRLPIPHGPSAGTFQVASQSHMRGIYSACGLEIAALADVVPTPPPPPPAGLIPQSSGTPIGNMTTGGIIRLFDGVTIGTAGLAMSYATSPSWAGKDYGGSPKTPTGFKVYASNDYGYSSSLGIPITWTLFGSNAAPGAWNDGISLGSATVSEVSNVVASKLDISGAAAYRYLWVVTDYRPGFAVGATEVEFYGS